ncbi:hypothetical protein JK361_33025 [Streptomyces sp. 5-8]|uniref:Uncharacterized protein n=2 Tax=Streptomyces musisoli TaxID=2802280 RepID=A0ABS1PAE9_9ACTN|nr:hypothetical protein [Streptomyces musisoli]MBL1109355.1 hypothetical protein [Streptomyces musisoli]
MTTRLLNALLDSHGMTMTPDQERRFSEAYFHHLQDRLRTPRAIKRYFGQAGATLGSLAGEVDIVDFLVVTFLRTSEPGVYRMLGRHRAELTGASIDPALHRDSRPGEHAERWKERLRQAGVAQDNLDGVLGLLGLLFPAVRQALGNGGDPRAAARRRGIGSQDYFDRYVVFTVPADDLPEAVFEQALAQLAAGTDGDEATQLLLRLRDDTHRIVRRIDQLRADNIPVPSAALLRAMADNYGQLTADPEAMGLLGATAECAPWPRASSSTCLPTSAPPLWPPWQPHPMEQPWPPEPSIAPPTPRAPPPNTSRPLNRGPPRPATPSSAAWPNTSHQPPGDPPQTSPTRTTP